MVHELVRFLSQGEVPTAAVDLNETVRTALARVEESGMGAWRCRLDLQADLPPVQANRLQLVKVLTNLLQNGIEAMQAPETRPIVVTVTTRACADGQQAQVTVGDAGPGIADDLLQHIFDPFFSTKPHGLGMGLAISRSIIKTLGGRLWAESAAGAGARFHITLPFIS